MNWRHKTTVAIELGERKLKIMILMFVNLELIA
jgi:hypothetical protein